MSENDKPDARDEITYAFSQLGRALKNERSYHETWFEGRFRIPR